MKVLLKWGQRGLLALALVAASVATQAQQPTATPQPTPVKVSSGEADLVKKLQKTAKMPERFKLAEEFLKKYPTSAARPQLSNFMLVEIANLKDADAKMSNIETYLSTFTEASEQDAALPVLLEAYIGAKKWDEAFELAPRVLEKQPDNVNALVQLAFQGADMARSNNRQHIDVATKYAAQAIVILEGDKKPTAFESDANWTEFKKSWRPSIYQAQGFLLMENAKREEARASFKKAVQVNPSDPVNYYALGLMSNDEYQLLAKQYKATPDGPARDAVLQKVNGKLDEVIDFYAQAIAKASSKPEYKNLQDQLMGDVQSYYKFRKGSLDGLQALIDKYKK